MCGVKPTGKDVSNTLVCCCPYSVVNQTKPKVELPKFIMPELQIKIPGLTLSPTSTLIKSQSEDGSYRIEVPWIAEYIKAIYNYGLGIVGILAALVLMGGGVLWLISGGDASKNTQAKEMIIGSVTGLTILACSYIILFQVNPELTKLKPISLGSIAHLDFEEPEGDKEDDIKYGSTTRSQTTRIVVHTAAGLGTRDDVDKYHKKKGWSGIGYNVYIERDGRVVMGRGEDTRGAHSLKYNSTSLGISYAGCNKSSQWNNKTLKEAVDNGTITQTQLDNLIAKIKFYQQKYNIPRDKVIGHYEEPVAKACPCLPMDELRSKINP